MPKKGEKLSPEHKAAMAAGRARKQIIETPDQIAERMAAGHKRQEALKANADKVIERAEGFINETGAIAIDPAKLDVKNVDPEIGSKWNAERGDIPFEGKRQDRYYSWVTRDDYYTGRAMTSIRAMLSAMRRVGWQPITSADAEAHDHQLGATGRRICGDCELWWIPMWKWDALLELNRRRDAEKQSLVSIEQGFGERVNRTGVGRGLGADVLGRVYGADRMQPVTYSNQFSPNQIRR